MQSTVRPTWGGNFQCQYCHFSGLCSISSSSRPDNISVCITHCEARVRAREHQPRNMCECEGWWKKVLVPPFFFFRKSAPSYFFFYYHFGWSPLPVRARQSTYLGLHSDHRRQSAQKWLPSPSSIFLCSNKFCFLPQGFGHFFPVITPPLTPVYNSVDWVLVLRLEVSCHERTKY